MSGRDDVEVFAALLRRLKDRTDRSYGSLARRVNMNTSTLHRYCAGEAVPQDFAPVERLAAFCQATPQERLELHRLWLAAVAARQRVRTGGPAEAVVPVSAPRPAPAWATAPDGQRAEAGEGAESGEPVEAGELSETGDPVAENSSAGQPGGAPGPDASAPSPAPRPWYRRRRVLASTAVVCAVLATLSSTHILTNDDSSGADASRPGGPRTAAPGAPHRSAKPSATASPAPSGSSASPGPRQEKAPASSATGRDPVSSAKPATEPPLTVSTDSVVWNEGCGHEYVVDKPPAQVPPPPVEQDAGVWASTQGAVHGRETTVQISVQGRSSTAVVLEALHVRIVSRESPEPGNAYSMGQGCGGDITPRSFTVNLDVDRPITRPASGADTGNVVPTVHFPYRVSAEDPEVLLVYATTQAYDARWYLELDWSSQGRSGTIRIDDHGRPFHTTSIKGMPHYWFGTNDAGERAWVPSES